MTLEVVIKKIIDNSMKDINPDIKENIFKLLYLIPWKILIK
jgi:hypothetical protein